MKKVLIGMLLVVSAVVYAGQRYSVDVRMQSQNRYYDQNSGNIIIVQFCSIANGKAILDLEYDGTGEMIFSNGTRCPVLGVTK